MKTLFWIAGLFLVVLVAVNLGTGLQVQMLTVDQQSAQVEVTKSQAELNSAEARKANAEAHRIEDELKRDQYGWTAVTMEESGLGNVIGGVVLIGVVVLLFALGSFALIFRPPWARHS